MLTVQHNFTTGRSSQKIPFKSAVTIDVDRDRLEEKKQYYKEQAKQFRELEEDPSTPSTFKKIMKGFRIISEGFVDGIAVYYGATQGSKFLRKIGSKGVPTKVARILNKVYEPMAKGVRASATYISGIASDCASKVKARPWFEKFSNNKVGKLVISCFEYVSKGFKKVVSWLSEGLDKLFKTTQNTNGSIYDKATKATATTLGVGAGTAGAYTAAAKPEENEIEETSAKAKDVDDEDDLIDDIENDYESIEDAEIIDEKIYEED